MRGVISRYLNIWKWLQFFALGLVLLGAFAPLPKVLDLIFSVVGGVLFLIYLGAAWWEERRERNADQSGRDAISSSDQI